MISTRAAQSFLDLDRIAVIGASADERKFGNVVYRALRDAGKDVVAVHPTATAVAGDPCFASVAEVPGGVDGAVVMTPPAAAAGAVRSAIDAGVRRIWLFKGIGAAGSATREAIELCTSEGVEVVAGACPLMFLEPVGGAHRLHRTMRRFTGAVAA